MTVCRQGDVDWSAVSAVDAFAFRTAGDVVVAGEIADPSDLVHDVEQLGGRHESSRHA